MQNRKRKNEDWQTIQNKSEFNLRPKVLLLRCDVFPVLLKYVETWTISEASKKRWKTLLTGIYLLRISWTGHVTNNNVLKRLNKEKGVMKLVKQRKLEYLGYIMRNKQRYVMLQLVRQGKVDRKRGPGTRRISRLRNVNTSFSATTTRIFRTHLSRVASETEKIVILIVNRVCVPRSIFYFAHSQFL